MHKTSVNPTDFIRFPWGFQGRYSVRRPLAKEVRAYYLRQERGGHQGIQSKSACVFLRVGGSDRTCGATSEFLVGRGLQFCSFRLR